MSSIDVYDFKRRFSRVTPFTKLHLEYEAYDYPLVDAKTGVNIIERCNKLCSGDYVTSFASTFFQIATYDKIKEMFDLEDYLCGGDDAALLIKPLNTRRVRDVFRKTRR